MNRILALNLLSVYLIWGSTYYAIKLSIEAMPPLLMLAARFFIAALIIRFFCLLKDIRFPKSAGAYFSEFAVGNLLLLGGLGAVAFAEKWISSALAAIVIATVPIWLLVLDFLINRKRVSTIEALLLAVGFVGVVMLHYYEIKGHSLFVIVLCLIAPLSWSLGSLLQKRVAARRPLDAIVSSCLQMFFASVSFLLLFLLSPNEFYFRLNPPALFSVVYLIIFGSLLAFSSYIYLCNQNISPVLLGSYAYVNPVVAILIGLSLGGEFISANGYIAIAIILSSVMLLISQQHRTGTTKD
ncbi:MAG: EamA family transporter [bacterium]